MEQYGYIKTGIPHTCGEDLVYNLVLPESVHTAPAKGREGAAATAEVRTIEIVVGAAWKDHGAIERFMDRVAGSGSRLSTGLWQVSAHLKRLGSSVGLVRCCL